MVLLVTLEGLPHAGRACVLRHLLHQRPGWAALNVAPDPATACVWASAECRAHHAQFASLMRKLHGLARCEGTGVVLLNSPWFEHLTCHPVVRGLVGEMTAELVARLGCPVRGHLMVLLDVPADETFEQMVCSGNPTWNGTSLADVRAAQAAIAHGMRGARDGSEPHPFPAELVTLRCPAFFEENEVLARGIAQAIVAAVESTASPYGEAARTRA